MKIRPVGAELFHADGRTDRRTTDMTKLIFAFCTFANSPKNAYVNLASKEPAVEVNA